MDKIGRPFILTKAYPNQDEMEDMSFVCLDYKESYPYPIVSDYSGYLFTEEEVQWI